MVTRAAHALRSAAFVTAIVALDACATSQATTVRGATSDAAWADSVLTTLSLRDKAAQMVWPWILGDYTAVDNAAWRRVERLVREQKLGGVIISVNFAAASWLSLYARNSARASSFICPKV